MNKKAVVFIAGGAVGAAAIMSYDSITGKPVNDFTGPVSTPALILCAILILIGIILIIKNLRAIKPGLPFDAHVP